jgi:hypothetical protein
MLSVIHGYHGGTAKVTYYFKFNRLAIGQGQGFNAKLQYSALEY